MAEPRAMSEFATPGVGVRTLLGRLGIEDDFAGCYVLVDNGKPIYVGISKKVVDRLRQHVLGTTHHAASLAYRIAKKNAPHALTRKGDTLGNLRRFRAFLRESRPDLLVTNNWRSIEFAMAAPANTWGGAA